jgi:hypothetical protein
MQKKELFLMIVKTILGFVSLFFFSVSIGYTLGMKEATLLNFFYLFLSFLLYSLFNKIHLVPSVEKEKTKKSLKKRKK